MRECGLTTVKQQLTLKKLLPMKEATPLTSSPIPSRKSESGKLSMPEIKKLTPEEKHLYLIK